MLNVPDRNYLTSPEAPSTLQRSYMIGRVDETMRKLGNYINHHKIEMAINEVLWGKIPKELRPQVLGIVMSKGARIPYAALTQEDIANAYNDRLEPEDGPINLNATSGEAVTYRVTMITKELINHSTFFLTRETRKDMGENDLIYLNNEYKATT